MHIETALRNNEKKWGISLPVWGTRPPKKLAIFAMFTFRRSIATLVWAMAL
jgi:hypothetical protein